MSRVITEKKERSLGVKLFIKQERCNSPKCVMVRRPQRPGVHGKRRRTLSEFGTQLLEKQKIQLTYGLTDRQMKTLFAQSKDAVLETLESRLDRVVFVAQLAASSRVARQLVSHGHVHVNGRKTTIPSYRVRKGDVVSIRPESKTLAFGQSIQERLSRASSLSWFTINAKELSITCTQNPQPDVMNFPYHLDAVGEFYSR